MKKRLLIISILFFNLSVWAQVKEDMIYAIRYSNKIDAYITAAEDGYLQFSADKDLATQRFQFISTGDGRWYIKNIGTGLVLDIVREKARDLKFIRLTAQANKETQKFKLYSDKMQTNHYRLKGGKPSSSHYITSETMHAWTGTKLMGYSQMCKQNLFFFHKDPNFQDLPKGSIHVQYLPKIGQGRLYANGKMLKQQAGWRRDWDAVLTIGTTGNNGPANKVLFYSKKTGEAEIYRVDASGNMQKLQHFKNWGKNWSKISWENSNNGLLQFNAPNGYWEKYTCDQNGIINLHSKKQ